MLHSAQLRAARALLDWRQEDLARQSGVGIATIQRIEKEDGPVMGHVSTQLRLREALEAAGVRFLDIDGQAGIGVRLVLKAVKKRARFLRG